MLKKASFLKEQTFSLIRSLEAHISEVTTAALGQEHAEVNSPDETDNNDSSYIGLSNSIAVHMAKGTRVPGLIHSMNRLLMNYNSFILFNVCFPQQEHNC